MKIEHSLWERVLHPRPEAPLFQLWELIALSFPIAALIGAWFTSAWVLFTYEQPRQMTDNFVHYPVAAMEAQKWRLKKLELLPGIPRPLGLAEPMIFVKMPPVRPALYALGDQQ